MEEDVEIEMLLKSNEQMLLEAAEDLVVGDKSDEELIELTSDGELVNNSTRKIPEKVNMPESKELGSEESAEFNLTIGKDKADETNLSDKSEYHLQLLQNKSVGDDSIQIKRTELNYTDEVQSLLDDEIVSCMAKEPIKHFALLDSSESDSDSDSEDLYVDNDNYFINEIMADDEPEYRGEVVEQLRKQVGNKSKQHIQNETPVELVQWQTSILERDDLLTKLEAQLLQQLQECEEKIQKVYDTISEPRSNNRPREPSFTKCFFKKFGMPYFEDSNGFPAPYNEDHIKKERRGELIVTSIPKIHYWTKAHKEIFLETVKHILIDENSKKLQSEIYKLTTILDNSLEVDDGLVEKLTRCREKLQNIRSLSYADLVSQEDPNREYDWMRISASVFSRIHSAEECKRFWHIYLKPTVNKASWEVHEDLKLLEIAEQMQYQDWDAIAKLLGTSRTAYQCLVHFQTRIHMKRNFSMGKWTEEEDKKLISVINASKIGNFIPWTKVSSYMVNRTHNQIYNRWTNCLNPKLVKGKFTNEEDLLIVAGIEVFGMSFREMSSLITNRSCAQIRERYERHLHPRTAKTGTWSLEEDKKLLSLVQQHGEQNWVLVAKHMKTRSRTQVRQRYGFIQRMIKTKPGWTVSRVKRRHQSGISKLLEKTKKNVQKVKEEINKVETVFKLSKLESDTFKIEKLKELRDKIMLKKFDLKRKKKVFSDSSEVNNLLLEYFKYSQIKPPVTPATFRNYCDSNAYLNEILVLAKYFGHELELPQFEDEIWANPRLSYNLKCVLTDALDQRTGFSTNQNSVSDQTCSSPSVTCENNIDYIAPDEDDSLVMFDWWHTPPVDVTRLNFSELFKRTVFDYSYGMHRDIWESKVNRSPVVNLSCFSETPELPQKPHQLYYIPPNHPTTLGFRSLLLSRTRLRRDSTDVGFSGKLFPRPEKPPLSVKIDRELNSKFIDQFQETMISLFTWPKVLSLTNIDSTSVRPTQDNGIRVIPIQPSHPIKIATLLNDSHQHDDEQVLERMNENIKQERIRKTVLEQNQDRKRQKLDYKRGISYDRKMKIEHLVTNVKLKADETSSSPSTPRVQEKGEWQSNTSTRETRKRGRPPSNDSIPRRRKRGRQPSDESTSENLKRDRSPSNASAPATSKRGRPYKSRDASCNPDVDNPVITEQVTNDNVDSLNTDTSITTQTTDTGVSCSTAEIDLSTCDNDSITLPEVNAPLHVQPIKVTYRRSARNMKSAVSIEKTCKLVQKRRKRGRINENNTLESNQAQSHPEDHPNLQR